MTITYDTRGIIWVFVLGFLLTFFSRWDGGRGLCGGRSSRSLSGCWHWTHTQKQRETRQGHRSLWQWQVAPSTGLSADRTHTVNKLAQWETAVACFYYAETFLIFPLKAEFWTFTEKRFLVQSVFTTYVSMSNPAAVLSIAESQQTDFIFLISGQQKYHFHHSCICLTRGCFQSKQPQVKVCQGNYFAESSGFCQTGI